MGVVEEEEEEEVEVVEEERLPEATRTLVGYSLQKFNHRKKKEMMDLR